MKGVCVPRLLCGLIVPNWLLIRKEMTPAAKLCYAILCQYSNNDGEADPTLKEIADRMAVSRDTVQRAIAELAKHALLSIRRNGKGRRNTLVFLPHPWWGNDIEWPQLAPTLNQNGKDGKVTATCGNPSPPPPGRWPQLAPTLNQRANRTLRPPAIIIQDFFKNKEPEKSLTSVFIKRWYASFRRVFGQSYLMTGADGPAASKLVRTEETTIDSLIDLAEKAWQKPSKFWCKQAVTIAGFARALVNIRAELGELKPKQTEQGFADWGRRSNE